MAKPFYITTTLPYVNADPHIGFAMEIVRADAVARYRMQLGDDVFFNTGTDEHGLKIYRKALEEGKDPRSYVDAYAEKFKGLRDLLDLSPAVHFIRTTDEQHVRAAQEFWRIVAHNGFIYKKLYKVRYCVGCELEKTDSELVDGRCPVHPEQQLEEIHEENYFFRFSDFRQQLLDLYASRPGFVVPDFRFNEIKAFVERGLEDFSISRLAKKMPWGVPVPGDPDHVMYVWFDALVNYISAAGWPSDIDRFNRFWVKSGGVVQYCGKDNIRQQSAMWQAMLMAAYLPPSQAIIIDGFVTSGGQKMSKSAGNVIDPAAFAGEYGADALRYFLLRELAPFEDGDVTPELFKAAYNANLANGLGNLLSRVMRMADTTGAAYDPAYTIPEALKAREAYAVAFSRYDLRAASDAVWQLIGFADGYIQKEQPFKKVQGDPEGAKADLKLLLAILGTVADLLVPLLPATAGRVRACLVSGTMPSSPLFPRKE